MTPINIGILGIILLFVMLALRLPVGITMVIVALIGNTLLTNFNAALNKFGSDAIILIGNYSLSVIPLFVLMGLFLSKARVAADLYDVMNDVFRKFRGSMAIATLGAAAVFGAVCGSATAAASTIGSLSVPEMTKHKYNQGFSASVAAVGSTLGILIPPSTTLILYGVLTEESIGRVLIGGFLPGVMLTVMLMITAYLLLRSKPELGPPVTETSSFSAVSWRKVLYVWPIPVIFIVSIGGIYAGYFTPTEAGAAGAFMAFVLALVTRRLKWPNFVDALSSSASIAAMVFMIILGGKLFGTFLTRSRIPYELSDYIINLDVSPFMIVMIILLIYTVMGFFMDELATLVIMTPIMYPIVLNLGYDPIWFGVLTTMMLLSGLLTPPVGVVSLVVSSVTKIPSEQVFRYQIPFWITLVIGAVLVTAFPQIVLFLPNLMF